MAELKVARKVNAAGMDRSRMAVIGARSSKKSPEVQAQQHNVPIFAVACPYCGQILAEELNSTDFEWFTCSVCGGAFQA